MQVVEEFGALLPILARKYAGEDGAPAINDGCGFKGGEADFRAE